MPDRERLRHLAVDRHHRVRPDPGRRTCLPGAPHDRGDQQGCRRGPGHRVDRQLGSHRVHDQVPAGVEEEAGEPAAEDPAESARPTQSATEHRHPDAVAHQPGEDHVHERPEDSTHDPDVEHPGHIRGRVDDGEHRGVHDILEDLETESHEHAGDQSVPGAVPPRPADLQQQPDAQAFRQFLGVCPAEGHGDLRDAEVVGQFHEMPGGRRYPDQQRTGPAPYDGREGEQHRRTAVDQQPGHPEPHQRQVHRTDPEGKCDDRRAGEDEVADHDERRERQTAEGQQDVGPGEHVPRRTQPRTLILGESIVVGPRHLGDLPVPGGGRLFAGVLVVGVMLIRLHRLHRSSSPCPRPRRGRGRAAH